MYLVLGRYEQVLLHKSLWSSELVCYFYFHWVSQRCTLQLCDFASHCSAEQVRVALTWDHCEQLVDLHI
jgi:peroxiredoxin